MARITIVYHGPEEDVHPLIALAQQLRNSGHSVRLATNAEHADLVQSHALDHSSLSGDFEENLRESGSRPGVQGIARGRSAFFEKFARTWSREGTEACADAQCVIGCGSMLYVAAAFAEAVGALYVECMLSPRMLVADAAEVTRFLKFAWSVQRRAIDGILRPALRLAPCPEGGAHVSLRGRSCPILCAFSPTLGLQAAKLPSYVSASGFWYLETPETWEPAADLVQFLEREPFPVYVELDDTLRPDGSSPLRCAIRALVESGQSAIIGSRSSTDELEQQFAQHGLVFVTGLPHVWILPRVRVVVHHARTNLIGEALRTGLPSVTMPTFGEEFYWAKSLTAIGLAAPSLTWSKLNGVDLGGSLRVAAALGEAEALKNTWRLRLRAERGAASAAEAVGRWIEPRAH